MELETAFEIPRRWRFTPQMRSGAQKSGGPTGHGTRTVTRRGPVFRHIPPQPSPRLSGTCWPRCGALCPHVRVHGEGHRGHTGHFESEGQTQQAVLALLSRGAISTLTPLPGGDTLWALRESDGAQPGPSCPPRGPQGPPPGAGSLPASGGSLSVPVPRTGWWTAGAFRPRSRTGRFFSGASFWVLLLT